MEQSVSFTKKVGNAAKWSILAEVIAKLIGPVTNMILARILVPEAFGVVATVNMIISFADMFTDSGFQKYLVQHEFNTEKEKIQNINVAFWTNLMISLILWFIIALFKDPIASSVGNPGLGHVIAISCMQLPITSFSSIQMALYRRSFDFKTLFWIRIITALIPLIITVPLAISGFSYWSLIIGSTIGLLVKSIILTIKSEWKPSMFYSIKILKEMASFSIWSLLEAISIWLTSWIDTIIIGSALNQYYLGLYKNSLNMVNSIMGIITTSITSVLFSSLSRLQNDDKKFNNMFFDAQKIISYFVLPLGAGIFLYRDFITQVLLGSQWNEASNIIGVWSLTSAIMICTSNLESEVYRSKGKPKLSLISQIIHLIFLVPTCLISLNHGFWSLVYSRAFIRLQSVIVGFIFMNYIIKIKPKYIIKNISRPVIYTSIMSIISIALNKVAEGILWDIICIIVCVATYFLLILVFDKDEVIKIIKKFNK